MPGLLPFFVEQVLNRCGDGEVGHAGDLGELGGALGPGELLPLLQPVLVLLVLGVAHQLRLPEGARQGLIDCLLEALWRCGSLGGRLHPPAARSA